MEEMALEIPKPTRRNKRDKQGKTAKSVTLLCRRSYERDLVDTLPDTTTGDQKAKIRSRKSYKL